jgi:hypothetical protein
MNNILTRRTQADVVIGIDPDVGLSGVAVLNTETGECQLFKAIFVDVIRRVRSVRDADAEKKLVVVVEAGWLNDKASWHVVPSERPEVAAKKGLAVGRNQQIGMDLRDVLAAEPGVKVAERAPLFKCWHGPNRKITHWELARIIPGLPGRTNQEQRDAALLAWVYAGRAVSVPKK